MIRVLNNRLTVFGFLLLILFASKSCSDKNDKKYTGDPEVLYLDYQVSGKEGDDNLTILLQFRDGGEDGDGVSLVPAGSVKLDGEEIPVDSTKMTGFFYELHKPIAAFAGKHSIVFTSGNKEYKEEFDFNPMTLLTPMADSIGRNEYVAGPMVIGFEGLEKEDFIRVLINDTSVNNDINRVDTVRDGRLLITPTDFDKLASGPVQIEFIREYERPVKNGTTLGGRLLITYSLKREFVLKD